MLRQFSIRQVVVAAMAALAALALGGLALMLVVASRAGAGVEQEFEKLLTDQEIAVGIVNHSQSQLAAAERYIVSGEGADLDAFRDEGTAVYDEIRRYLFRDLGPDERQLVESIRERHEEIEVAAQRLFSDTVASAIGQLPEVSALNMALDSLIDLRRATSVRLLEEQRATWRWLFIVCVALVLVFLVALMLVAAFLRQRLIEPLTDLAGAARRVGSGDFDQRVHVVGTDELAEVASSFNDMAEGLLAARRETADSEERYHSMFERIPVGLYRSTPDGRLLAGNRALRQLVGYQTRDQMMRSNAADVYVDTGDRMRWQHQLDHAPGVVEVDRQHTRSDGSIIWVRDTARAVRDERGRVLYYEGALQDVTARVQAEEAVRRSEARFRSLIENAAEGVLILSAEGMILYQSPAIERMLGYEAEETLGQLRLDVVHPDDVAAVTELYLGLQQQPGSAGSIEFRCRHSAGGWRVVQATCTNLLTDPAVGGFVVNMTDTTVRHQLEQQLQHAQKMEAVGRLAGGIAHDFNNLLTAIQGYTDMLGEHGTSDDGFRSDLHEIGRAVERAARLTRQLLAFSRRQVVRRRPTDVSAVIGELDQMLRRLLTEGVPLDTRVEPDCWVSIDPGQLEQVVVNLVVNARDAEPKTGISIDVRSIANNHIDDIDAPGLSGGDFIVITVRDDGQGIAEEDIPFIFDPFFTTKAVGKGTGLGLATVYGIIEESGGRVYARSTPDAGTVMRVFLPRGPRPERSTATVDRDVPEQPGTESILLVEDEPAVRSLAERVLRKHGYAVHSAGDGVEALALLEAGGFEPDLLVTDVVMPAMGGVQLAQRMLAERPSLQVLFISGYAADAVPSTADDGRPLYFLEKPFSPRTLGQTVRDILDTRTAPV